MVTIIQVVLSPQLPFTILPLIVLTSSKRGMGSEYVNKPWEKTLAWVVATIIMAFNAYLLWHL